MNEEQLVFLISQPRSGSTLTQKLLGAHSNIYTRSEPWLMLHPIYALKDKGISTEYSHHLGRIALNSFIEGLPDEKETYERELKAFYLKLYSYYLKGTQYRYFLDKTPRYYLIIDELMELFPKSKFVILIRNPISVLGSIIQTWTKQNWSMLSNYKCDLISAIDMIDKVASEHRENMYILHYEEIVSNPKDVLDKVFKFLDLEFEEEVLDYCKNNSEKWDLGDQGDVYEKSGVSAENMTKWQDELGDPQYWRVMYDYLLDIGEEKLNRLGYNFSHTLELLEQQMPAKTLEQLMAKTHGLASILTDTDGNQAELKALREKIDQKDYALQIRDELIEEQKREIDDKNRQIDKRDQVILRAKRELDEKQEHVELKSKESQEKDRLISRIQRQLKEQDKQIIAKEQEIREKDRSISEKDQELSSKTRLIHKKEQELLDVYSSRIYRLGYVIAYPYLKFRDKIDRS